MEMLLEFLASLSGQGMKIHGGPALIMKKFALRARPQRRDPVLLEVTGRRSGLMAFLLNLFGLDPTTHLTITSVEVTRRSTSMFGQTMDVIPIRQVSFIQAGASSPIALVFMAIFAGVFALPLLAVSPEAAMIPFGIAAMFVIAYFLQGKRFTLGVQSTSGTTIAISIKPKMVEGKMVDLETLQSVVTVVRELVVAGSGGVASGSAAMQSAAPMSLDDDHVMQAEEVFEVTAVEETDMPFAKAEPEPASSFAFDDDPQAARDPEEEARNMFKQAADLFKGGKKREAIALWEKLVRTYPSTQAGQAAIRNLEKLRHQG